LRQCVCASDALDSVTASARDGRRWDADKLWTMNSDDDAPSVRYLPARHAVKGAECARDLGAVAVSETEDSAIVLVVDDDDMVRRAAARVLARHYRVEEFADAGEAVARVLAGGITLVVTDMSMPSMSGLELSRRVRSYDPALPVVLMTATGSAELRLRALSEGIADYLAKPFEPTELLEAVERAVSLEHVAQSERRSHPGRARSAS
jgi:CheY-like chemotaxis protein